MNAILRLRSGARRLKRIWDNLLAHLHDAHSFAQGSGLLSDRSASSKAAQVLKTAHRLEKGLALPNPRPGFGSGAAELLRVQLQQHFSASGADWVWKAGQDALVRRAHHARGVSAHTLSAPMSAREVQAAARGEFPALVGIRRSVRQFAPGPVPWGCLQRASELAAMSPSVCNRSGARVWVVTDPAQRERVLALQDGHQGFGDRASAVAIITVDTTVFHTVGERHQAWVDGGLFAMTYLYALHHQGLGTCCLNWCVTPATDRQFKRSIGLPPHEAVVMLVAIGRLPEQFTVAHSPRRPLSEVMRTLEGRV